MSEEEKKAIEWLKNASFFSARLYAPIILNLIDRLKKEIEESQNEFDIEHMKNYTLLKRIEKQQKEIEELIKENNNIWLHIPRLD